MAKVIVERPRRGSRNGAQKKGYRKFLQRTSMDELPRREPMLGHWQGLGRSLNEHLGPLRRFLRSCVGRPWNKVHQELCEHVNFDNAVQNHVLTHIFQYVELHVEIHDGRPCYGPKHGWSWRRWGQPLREGQMYVCPQSGLLREVRPARSHPPPTRVMGQGRVQFHRRHDAWWEVRLRELPAVPGEQWDLLLERPLVRIPLAELVTLYSGKLYAVSKRLLSPREERALRGKLRRQNGRRRRRSKRR